MIFQVAKVTYLWESCFRHLYCPFFHLKMRFVCVFFIPLPRKK